MIDWKRNNKVAIRNFDINVDFHDLVKLLIVKMLRRRYSDSSRFPIYTEFNAEEPNESYPDIWMRIKQDIVVYEIQDKITENWKKKIEKKYEINNLIIVPLQTVWKEWKELSEKTEFNPIENLRKVLEKYII